MCIFFCKKIYKISYLKWYFCLIKFVSVSTSVHIACTERIFFMFIERQQIMCPFLFFINHIYLANQKNFSTRIAVSVFSVAQWRKLLRRFERCQPEQGSSLRLRKRIPKIRSLPATGHHQLAHWTHLLSGEPCNNCELNLC